MNLNWRTQRQFIIFATYFLIVFIPVFWISYNLLSKHPTCFDGIQNGNEESVDCNGSCELRCDGTYRDIRINFVRGVKVTDGVYDIFALLENYNTKIIFPYVPYTMSIYNSEGKLMATSSGDFSILPQRKNAIFIPSLPLAQAPTTIDLNLEPHKALAFYDELPQTISVENWKAQRGANDSLQVVGELKNLNNFDVNDITVYALLYDDTKTVYAVSKTKLKSILGRQRTAVTFTWGNIPAPKNADFVVVFNE
jgi:hypothetical protein